MTLNAGPSLAFYPGRGGVLPGGSSPKLRRTAMLSDDSQESMGFERQQPGQGYAAEAGAAVPQLRRAALTWASRWIPSERKQGSRFK